MPASLPAIATLPHATDDKLTQVLDLLFEPCDLLHTLSLPVLRSTTFPSYDTLVAAVGSQLRALATSSDTQRLDAILCAHPRLGEKKVASEQSRAEQAGLQGSDEEREQLAKLNREYEDVFPGLRYVVFVNGRPRPEIMQNMRERIARRDIQAERQDAIQAMCDIALDRASKLHQE